MAYRIDGHVTGDDDGYRFRDWFAAGAIEAAEAADSHEEAERIMREGYLGADVDGVEAVWTVEDAFKVGDRIVAGGGEDRETGVILEIDGDCAAVGWRQGQRTWVRLADLERA